MSELLILREIMSRVQSRKKLPGEPLPEMPRPCDYFDLIGGTGTGGYVIYSVKKRSVPHFLTLGRFIES